jgi:hypothetical protein
MIICCHSLVLVFVPRVSDAAVIQLAEVVARGELQFYAPGEFELVKVHACLC